MESATNVAIQLAMVPVALAMVAALFGLLGFGIGFWLGFWGDIRRGISKLWLLVWAEVALDKEEKRTEKQSRRAAAMEAARRRRATGRRPE